jgi:hypothetical protein
MNAVSTPLLAPRPINGEPAADTIELAKPLSR